MQTNQGISDNTIIHVFERLAKHRSGFIAAHAPQRLHGIGPNASIGVAQPLLSPAPILIRLPNQ